MSKLCGDGCHELCDFCKHFLEADEDILEYGDGICDITHEEVNRCDYCTDDFVCFRIKDGE